MPALPRELFYKFTREYLLSEYDTNVIIEEKDIALYYNDICQYTKNYKVAANFVNGPIKSYINDNAIDISQIKISPKNIAKLVLLVDEGKISNTVATQKIFPKMINSKLSPEEIAKNNNWIQESDTTTLQKYVEIAMNKYPKKVLEYQSGKKGLLGLFMGEVMKLSKGNADPKLASQMIQKQLEK